MVKEHTVVKVCCPHFKSEVEQALKKKLGESLVTHPIRFSLPIAGTLGIFSYGELPNED